MTSAFSWQKTLLVFAFFFLIWGGFAEHTQLNSPTLNMHMM